MADAPALWLTRCIAPTGTILTFILAEGEAAPLPVIWTRRFSAEEIAAVETRGRLLADALAERFPMPRGRAGREARAA